MMCWSASSPAGCISIRITMTHSDMSGHWSVAVISYYVLLYWMDGSEDGFGYVYQDYYCIYFNYLLDAHLCML
jgi:hypothetical protein